MSFWNVIAPIWLKIEYIKPLSLDKTSMAYKNEGNIIFQSLAEQIGIITVFLVFVSIILIIILLGELNNNFYQSSIGQPWLNQDQNNAAIKDFWCLELNWIII